MRELSRLYRLVNRLMDYPEQVAKRDRLAAMLVDPERLVEQLTAEKRPGRQGKACKAERAGQSPAKGRAQSARAAGRAGGGRIAGRRLGERSVGDALCSHEHRRHRRRPCWPKRPSCTPAIRKTCGCGKEFLPACLDEIERIYRRLGVITFDHTLGESFYHDRLAGVVDDLLERGIARESDGAICVFLPGYEAPLIVRKQDGAFLYATTDLATIQYRMSTWQPDAILYVVDHRQSLHFEQLFATARLWGYEAVELVHVGFGTVLGGDGKPFKTRSGDTVGLEGLLDEAVAAGAGDRQRQRRRQAAMGRSCRTPSGARWPKRSASARSNMPTCRRTAPATTSSATTRCWP